MKYVEKPLGATVEEIKRIESVYGVDLPSDLKEWWLDSDGPIVYFDFKELQFFSVNEIIGEDIFNLKLHMPSCIPLCFDGYGNICVARLKEGKVSGIYVASSSELSWDNSRLISTTFSGFIDDGMSPKEHLYA